MTSMMEEVGMVMKEVWKRRNGVMRTISVASIFLNVVMLVLNKRLMMGNILVNNYVEVRGLYTALVHMVTSHPSLQRPLLYLLLNILLIFPLLLQSGLLNHHNDHRYNKYMTPSNTIGKPYRVVTTGMHKHNRLTRRLHSHMHDKHTTYDNATCEHKYSRHNKRSHKLNFVHDLNDQKRSSHPPPQEQQHHYCSHNTPRHGHLPLQQQSPHSQTSPLLDPNVAISISQQLQQHPHHQMGDTLHRTSTPHHQMGDTLHLTSNIRSEENPRGEENVNHDIAELNPRGMSTSTMIDTVIVRASHTEEGDESDMRRGMVSTVIGGVKRVKKPSLFTIEPLEEEVYDAKQWGNEEEMAATSNEMLYMWKAGEQGHGRNRVRNMGDQEEEDEEELQLSNTELKEKAEKFIRKFKRNLMKQRQDSFNRLLSLLRSA